MYTRPHAYQNRSARRCWHGPSLLAVGLTLAAGATAHGQTALVDFGPSSQTTATTAGGQHWNNVTAVSAGTALDNLVDDTGAATTVNLTIQQTFNVYPDSLNKLNDYDDGFLRSESTGYNDDDVLYPASAKGDSFAVRSGDSGTDGQIALTGLMPYGSYDLTIFGSRDNVTGTSLTRHLIATANGDPSTTKTLEERNNQTNTITLGGVPADRFGQLYVRFSTEHAAGDAASYGYGYLGVLQIDGPLPTPEPTSAVILGGMGAMTLLRRRRRDLDA